jgi:hypothetical protein
MLLQPLDEGTATQCWLPSSNSGPRKTWPCSCAALVVACAFHGEALSAQDLLADTYLLDVSTGSKRMQIVAAFAEGGYELSDGTPVRFYSWYAGPPDLNIKFLTEINPSFGLTWGINTGSRGEKYTMAPGLWIGAIYRMELGPQQSLTLSWTSMLGGRLRERDCLADYGEIGGVQRVNCRLAASVLSPEETLQFLANEPGSTEAQISITYQIDF